MSKPASQQLFNLIKSLSKSEKRHFKLFTKRISPEENKKFVSMFDVVDGMLVYDEAVLRKKVPQISETQIPNMKAHLYDQILRSLRMNAPKKSMSHQIVHLVENARILYEKCLYADALSLVDKAKAKARQADYFALMPELLELEKNALRQGMRQNISERTDNLIHESQLANHAIHNINSFSNLALKLNSYYQKQGFIRNPDDLKRTKKYLDQNLPAFSESKLSFTELIHLYNTLCGYYLFVQDFKKALTYSRKWVKLFSEHEEMQTFHTEFYIRALNTILVCLNKLDLYEEFMLMHRQLTAIKRNTKITLTKHLNLNLFKTIYIHEINRHFMLGEYRSGTRIVSKFQDELNKIIHLLDKHTVLIFYYKIACLYVGSSNFKTAIRWLNLVIYEPDTSLREDLHAFARILRLICYYELNDTNMIEMNIRATYRFLLRKKEFGKYESYILKFLREAGDAVTREVLIEKFSALKRHLVPLEKNIYERRAFYYFDIISYLDSKIEDKPIEQKVKEKLKLQQVAGRKGGRL